MRIRIRDLVNPGSGIRNGKTSRIRNTGRQSAVCSFFLCAPLDVAELPTLPVLYWYRTILISIKLLSLPYYCPSVFIFTLCCLRFNFKFME
jgi:hypothetical protein